MKLLKSIKYEASPVKGGYTDKILELNLTSMTLSISGVDPEFKQMYIGGRGYALKLIWDRTTDQTRYDSPENLLVMAGGPLCNEPRFPGTGKFVVGTISPLTDTFIDSNVGGHFAPLLKMCGFDALSVSGKAEKEVVLLVDGENGTIGIAEAPQFGGRTDKSALEYGTALLKKYGGALNEDNAAVTAGDGAIQTRYGIISSLYYDKRRKRIRGKQAGRGGTGTVMRAKGLKAVIVHSGQPRVHANHPVDEKRVSRAGAELKKVISQNDAKQLHLSAWGTTVLAEYMNKFHLLPIQNYQYGRHPEAHQIFSDVFLNRYFSKNVPDGCYLGCNLACAKGAEGIVLTRGPQKGRTVSVDGPEYETIGAVTCQGIFDPQFVMEYNWYCDDYGLDTISMGVCAGFLMECFQRGYLTVDDTGYPIPWGDMEAADRLLHETAKGEGLGKVCGQGVFRIKNWVAERYAKRTGKPTSETLVELNKFGMEVKGLEFSLYVTKESLAQQGGYGFALKGPQHDEAWLIFIDQVHGEIPTFEMKAQALKWFPLVRTWFNAVGLCKLHWIDVRHPDAAETENPSQNQPTLAYYAEYFSATTGIQKTVQDMLDDSERLHVLQKLINLRHGKGTRDFDQIPTRAMAPAFFNEYESRQDYYDQWLKESLGKNEDLPDSPEARHQMILKLRLAAYQKLCDVVYEAKGYTPDAIPLPETVKKFGLFDETAEILLKSFGIS